MQYQISVDISDYDKSRIVIYEPLTVAGFSKGTSRYRIGHQSRRFCNLPPPDGEELMSKTVEVSFIGVNLANGFRSLPLCMAKFCAPGDRIIDYLGMTHYSNFSLATRCSDFVADLGTLVRVAMTPYLSSSPKFSWSLRCYRVDSGIVIQMDDPDDAMLNKDLVTKKFKERYCREKFLRLCCGENEADICITPESVIELRKKCYRVNKMYMTKKSEKIRLFYASEEHCVRGGKPLIVDAYESDGLGKSSDWLERSLAWFLEAELVGAEHILVGLYSRDTQRVTRVVDMPTDVLAKRATWNAEICYSFLHSVLVKIRDAIYTEDFMLDTKSAGMPITAVFNATTVFGATYTPTSKNVELALNGISVQKE